MYNSGKIVLGLAIFVAVATAPIWYAAARGGKGAPPQLEKPRDAKQCVESASYMRVHHMEMLDSWRDAVVRRGERVYVASDGQRHDMSLTGTCLRCHGEPAKFCTRCHEYSGVEAFCWDCHQNKRRGSR